MNEVVRIFRKDDGALVTSDDDPGETSKPPAGGVFIYALIRKNGVEYIVKVPVTRQTLATTPAVAESMLTRVAEHF